MRRRRDFSPFPALYLASDKETALQELLGQVSENDNKDFSPMELALARPDSIINCECGWRVGADFRSHGSTNFTRFPSLD